MNDYVKEIITRFGALLTARAVYNLNAVTSYLEAGRWMRIEGYNIGHRVRRREDLFDHVAKKVSDRKVLYLEFGVYKGDVTRFWSQRLSNPSSHLHGFDSFEGLPEDWIQGRERAVFSTGGVVPEICDPRVRFFKGWFDQTLPSYDPPAHEVLVVICDADLHSSTTFVLNAIEKLIVPGTYLYFDEFHHQFDELRAFREFTQRTGMRFSLVGATRTLSNVMWQRTS
jgi:hypothetical protein